MSIKSFDDVFANADLRIERLAARIIDIPTIRQQHYHFGVVNTRSPVIVQLWLSNGACGFGEAATIGGPSWNEESPESIFQMIENYLAPSVIGKCAGRLEALISCMDAVCRGNYFAKSAVEMAAVDAVARAYGMPAWQLLGGKQRDSFSLTWALTTGNLAKDVKDAERMLAARRHRTFKIELGGRTPTDDVAHVSRIAEFLQGRGTMTADINQAWDTNTARRFVPQLIDAGIALVEQPLAKWNVEGLGQLTAGLSRTASLMADESVCTSQDAINAVRTNACHVFSLKVAKHGGLLRTRAVASIGTAADIRWFGGSMLETSLGSAASAHVFSTLPGEPHGCELVGPQLIAEDIVETPLTVRDFELRLPEGPGFGVNVVLERLERFDRKRQGLTPVHVDMGRSGTKLKSKVSQPAD